MGLAAEVAAERTCELRERSFLTFCSAPYDADATVKQYTKLGHTPRWRELDKLSSGDHEDVGCRVTQDPIQRLPENNGTAARAVPGCAKGRCRRYCSRKTARVTGLSHVSSRSFQCDALEELAAADLPDGTIGSEGLATLLAGFTRTRVKPYLPRRVRGFDVAVTHLGERFVIELQRHACVRVKVLDRHPAV